MHEKMDHLPNQNLKNKQTSGADKINHLFNYNLYAYNLQVLFYIAPLCYPELNPLSPDI